MSKIDITQLEGKVIEKLSNVTFRVELENGHQMFAYISGKLRMSYIRIPSGDRVAVGLSPYSPNKTRIAWKDK